ncbi:MAG: phospho-N-acetylmuramoyl-pentapeptide-transferase [Planctomycetota bacterium]
MLYWLWHTLREPINNSALLGPLNVLQWVEFRAVFALLLAFTLVVALGDKTIRALVRLKVGDSPEFHHQDLNQLMQEKRNVPTMGGILIVAAITAATLLLGNFESFYLTLGLVCLLVLGAIGFADDYLKLTTARRKPGSRDGLYSWEKLAYQIGLALILGYFIYQHGGNKIVGESTQLLEMSRSLSLPGLKSWAWDNAAQAWVPANQIVLPLVVFMFIAVFVIVGTSNAVNLTDGMDGLAAGTTTMVALAFAVLCWIAGYRYDEFIMAQYLLLPHIPLADELAVLAGAMAGACLGFLWFNCNPAKVFMGDTGSLALGGVLGFIAVTIRQEALLVIIGGIFVLEALSVIIQVAYFKATKGKRVFRCAPIHHHFHLGGWSEQQVVVRFWLATAMLIALALATIRVR